MGRYEDRVNDMDATLKSETGHGIDDWRSYIAFFAELMMTNPPTIEGQKTAVVDRKKAVTSFCILSALYEWAAISLLDKWFDTTGGSFGAFQAYFDNIVSSLAVKSVSQALRRIGSDAAARQAGLPILTDKEKEVVNNVLPQDNPLMNKAIAYWSPIVNMLGKVALSIYKAGLAKDANQPKPSPVWYLPDDVLLWVLMCFEGAGEEGANDRVHALNKVIKSFDEAGRTGNPIIEFNLGDLSTRRKPVASKLSIAIREKFNYNELLFPTGSVPPWRTGETPPYT